MVAYVILNDYVPVEGNAMHVMKWLVSAGALMSVTACVGAYPATTYGGYNNGYYGRPAYYQPAPRYVYQPAPSYRYYRDRNRDGVPDRYQRRNNWGW